MGACKDLHITPINLVLKHFATNRLAIVGVVLSKKDAKACAIALLVSQSAKIQECLYISKILLRGKKT